MGFHLKNKKPKATEWRTYLSEYNESKLRAMTDEAYGKDLQAYKALLGWANPNDAARLKKPTRVNCLCEIAR